MAEKIYKVLVILINSVQLALVIIIGLCFNCIIELLFLSLIFWSLRAILPTRHFGIMICTGLTCTYYILSSFIITQFSLIKFIPILFGIILLIIMKKKE